MDECLSIRWIIFFKTKLTKSLKIAHPSGTVFFNDQITIDAKIWVPGKKGNR
jgi:hypothetical protein